MVEIKSVHESHIKAVVENARQADIDEVRACSGMEFEEALRHCVDSSEWVAVAIADNDVLCIFGLSGLNYLTGEARPWMLGTNAINDHKREFFKESVRLRNEFLLFAPMLENYIHVKNVIAIRWLKKLGFQFDDDEVDGWHGEKLKRFYLCV